MRLWRRFCPSCRNDLTDRENRAILNIISYRWNYFAGGAADAAEKRMIPLPLLPDSGHADGGKQKLSEKEWVQQKSCTFFILQDHGNAVPASFAREYRPSPLGLTKAIAFVGGISIFLPVKRIFTKIRFFSVWETPAAAYPFSLGRIVKAALLQKTKEEKV